MKGLLRNTIILTVLLAASTAFGQLPAGEPTSAPKADTSIVFIPSHPLLEESNVTAGSLLNSWGFTGFFNDFGWGLGLYYRRILTEDLSIATQLDLGSAKGPKEFGFYTEIKLNRIFVFPLLASVQYRILSGVLGTSFRPYVTAGVGPAFIMTTDGQREFFSALGSPVVHTTLGGAIGVGAYFGSDPKSSLGASLKYYIIPYPSPGIESTAGTFLTDFNALSLSVSYGFSF